MINTCIGERGLGNNIATLSLLTQIANTGEQINIFTYPESGVEALIHAYKLSNNIHITHINIPGDSSGVELINNTSDVGKTLSPYIKYYNRNTDIKNKKYIGVEFYNHNGATDVFAQICKLAKDLKYDVISFDSLGCNLTEKINFLNNHCAAVISYGDESGTAHLAHTLDIPCVILPSDIPRDNNSFDNKWDTTPQFSYMQMHLDTQTYFLQDITELFSWKANMLEQVIKDLRQHKGNNKFLDEKTDITATTTLNSITIKTPTKTLHAFSKTENEWLKKYVINEAESVLIGGIRKVPLSPMVYNEFFLDHYNAAPDPIIPTIIPTPPTYNKYNPAPPTDIPTIIPTYNKYK